MIKKIKIQLILRYVYAILYCMCLQLLTHTHLLQLLTHTQAEFLSNPSQWDEDLL